MAIYSVLFSFLAHSASSIVAPSSPSVGATRDDSSIRTSTRSSSRGLQGGSGLEGGGGRGSRNRPVSMFEPRLGLSRGGRGVGGVGGVNGGGVGDPTQPRGGVGGVGEALQHHHHHHAVTEESTSTHPGWIHSYSARGEGPAGNVHQVRGILSQSLKKLKHASDYLQLFLFPPFLSSFSGSLGLLQRSH